MPEDHATDRPARVHVNAVSVTGGLYDLFIEFGYRSDVAGEPEVLAQMSMSWEHAKVMAKVMQRVVENYEGHVGALPDMERLREEEQ